MAARFCGQCGAPSACPPPPAAVREVDFAGRVEWVAEMPLATDRFLLYDLAKVILWTGALIAGGGTVVALAMGGASEPLEDWLAMLEILAWILAGFGLLFLLITVVFFGNRYRARMTVEAAGLSWESLSRRAGWSGKAAVLAGALAGNPTVAGAGLLAVSRQSVSIVWDDVKRVRCHPRLSVISIMNGWRVVLRLYCHPLRYEEIRSLIRGYAPHAQMEGDGTPVEEPPR